MKLRNYSSKKELKCSTCFFLLSLFLPDISAAADEDIHTITGDVGQYLGFDMNDVSDNTCRQGAPDYPRVTGLPAGMYSSGCTIYGRPEATGTSRVGFPVTNGIWLADLVVADEVPSSIPPTVDIHEIQGTIGQYLGFNMNDVSDNTCRQGLPDYPQITGLPAGMYLSGCSIYGRPEIEGTFRLEFPVVGGVWLADLVVGDVTDSADPVDPVDPTNPGTGPVTNCTHDGIGTDYPVGPNQAYANISDVPWTSLLPGDTVRIFWRDTPYKEKIIVGVSGTEQAPIRVCGVAGSNGEKPIILYLMDSISETSSHHLTLPG